MCPNSESYARLLRAAGVGVTLASSLIVLSHLFFRLFYTGVSPYSREGGGVYAREDTCRARGFLAAWATLQELA